MNYAIAKGNESFVRFLFPGYEVYEDYLPPFIVSKRVVFVGDKDISPPSKLRRFIQIKRNTGVKIDEKEGFIEFLQENIKLTQKTLNTLNSLEDEEFWNYAKLLYFFNIKKYSDIEEGTSVFVLFNLLFASFPEKYKVYKQIKLPHPVIMSSLMTMMAKTKDIEDLPVSTAYKKVLKKNQPYRPLFKARLLDYLDSPRKEMDFVCFLYNLSGGKNV